MEIYDSGYLTEDEKSTIDTQDLIYLAVSNYIGEPVNEILPKYVYEYTLEKNGTITRFQYENKSAREDTDILWDDFINARETSHQFYLIFRPYEKSAYIDDSGFVHTIKPDERITVNLQLDFVERHKSYKFIRPMDRNKAYFLELVSDREFMETLKKFGGSK